MKQFEGKTAVITGAASGIGLGMAEALANRGMKVVMADIEKSALDATVMRLQEQNLDVIGCVTDVTLQTNIARLSELAKEAYGNVHVLCNNAGVSGAIGGGRPIWEATDDEWNWVMGVNFRGVVNGLKAFVPSMLAHGEEGHIVNTSSILGLTTGGGSIYGVSKHAVSRLTEGLYHDLQAVGANLGVTLLCPGLIATNIVTSARNRPNGGDYLSGDRVSEIDAYFKQFGMPPQEVGELVADAIADNQFYLLTHPDNMEGVQRRFQDITSLREPTPPPAQN